MFNIKKLNKALILTAVIGLFLIGIMVYLDSYLKLSRDQKRIGDMEKIQIALDNFYQKNGHYPDSPIDGPCDKWDVGFWQKDKSDSFLQPLVTEGFLKESLGDPIFYANCNKGYFYHRYPCNNNSLFYPCYACQQPFYILGIKHMETKKAKELFPSPGFSCPTRNWALEFDYVIGKLED